MTARRDTCLTLILPRELESRVLDRLLQQTHWIGPFTTQRVEGHGDTNGIASVAEQVRGRVERVRIDVLMSTGHVADLLRELRGEVSGRDVLWWQVPVNDTGSLE